MAARPRAGRPRETETPDNESTRVRAGRGPPLGPRQRRGPTGRPPPVPPGGLYGAGRRGGQCAVILGHDRMPRPAVPGPRPGRPVCRHSHPRRPARRRGPPSPGNVRRAASRTNRRGIRAAKRPAGDGGPRGSVAGGGPTALPGSSAGPAPPRSLLGCSNRSGPRPPTRRGPVRGSRSPAARTSGRAGLGSRAARIVVGPPTYRARPAPCAAAQQRMPYAARDAPLAATPAAASLHAMHLRAGARALQSPGRRGLRARGTPHRTARRHRPRPAPPPRPPPPATAPARADRRPRPEAAG
jgi:hypothetical protein